VTLWLASEEVEWREREWREEMVEMLEPNVGWCTSQGIITSRMNEYEISRQRPRGRGNYGTSSKNLKEVHAQTLNSNAVAELETSHGNTTGSATAFDMFAC
jgi:hypothetical protein